MEIPSEESYYFNFYDRKFHAMFGFSKETVREVWRIVQKHGNKQQISIIHILWFFYFLKNYDNDEVSAEMFVVSRATYEKWIWKACTELRKINNVRLSR